jgi:peptide/nickel transport system permease protein
LSSINRTNAAADVGTMPLELGAGELVVETRLATAAASWRTASRRLIRNRLSLVGTTIVVLLVLTVLVGPLIWTTDPQAQDLLNRLASFSGDHPFGTDTNGRDVLARLLHGGRVTLAIAALSVAFALVVGGGIGLVSGYVRGPLDGFLMRVMDVILSFPSLLLALAIAAARGTGAANTVLAISIPAVPRFARLMRATVLSVREREYVLAARVVGVRPSRILFRHVLRNSVTPTAVQASIGVGVAILEVSALGYLGLGVEPPTPEWGAMLQEAQTYLIQDPLVMIVPGAVISIAILSFNLLGDAIRDVLDPGR